MRGFTFATPLLLLLASCAAPQVQFKNMTGLELAAYNRTVGRLDQVYCTERVDTGSHIRRRSCQTVQDILEGVPSPLNTPSLNRSWSVGSYRPVNTR